MLKLLFMFEQTNVSISRTENGLYYYNENKQKIISFMHFSYIQSVLMLPVVHHAVFGAYTCIVENIHGKLEKVVMLTEGAKPGTPHINPQKIYPDGLDLYIEVSYL